MEKYSDLVGANPATWTSWIPTINKPRFRLASHLGSGVNSEVYALGYRERDVWFSNDDETSSSDSDPDECSDSSCSFCNDGRSGSQGRSGSGSRSESRSGSRSESRSESRSGEDEEAEGKNSGCTCSSRSRANENNTKDARGKRVARERSAGCAEEKKAASPAVNGKGKRKAYDEDKNDEEEEGTGDEDEEKYACRSRCAGTCERACERGVRDAADLELNRVFQTGAGGKSQVVAKVFEHLDEDVCFGVWHAESDALIKMCHDELAGDDFIRKQRLSNEHESREMPAIYQTPCAVGLRAFENEALCHRALSGLVQRDLTPHVTVAFEALRHQNTGYLLMERISCTLDDFIYTVCSGDAGAFRGVFSDESRVEAVTKESVANLVFQTLFALNFLQRACNFKHHDFHTNNVFIKEIDDNTLFRGQSLKDVSYFHYHLDGEDYFLPNCGFLTKIGDFGMASIDLHGRRLYRTDVELFNDRIRRWGTWNREYVGEEGYDAQLLCADIPSTCKSAFRGYEAWVAKRACRNQRRRTRWVTTDGSDEEKKGADDADEEKKGADDDEGEEDEGDADQDQGDEGDEDQGDDDEYEDVDDEDEDEDEKKDDVRNTRHREKIRADKDALLELFEKLRVDAGATKDRVTRHKKRPAPGNISTKSADVLLRDLFSRSDARDPRPWYHAGMLRENCPPSVVSLGDTRWI